MPPSSEAIRMAATKARKTAAAAKKAEARSREESRPEAVIGVRAETRDGIEAERAQRAKLERTKRAKGKKAVIKAMKVTAAEGSGKKRPRSPLPTLPVQRVRVDQGAPIDISDHSPEVLETEVPPPPIQSEVEAPGIAAEPISVAAPAEGENEAGGLHEAVPEERVPTPTMAPEAEVEDFSFRSILDRKGKWAERLMSQVCLPELKKGLLSQGSSSFFRDMSVLHLWGMNSMAVMKEVLLEAEAALDQANKEAESAKIRADEARADKDKAEEALETAQIEIVKERSRAEKIELSLREAEDKIKRIEAESCSLEADLHTMTVLKCGFEERVENAEEIARDSDTRARIAEEKAEAAEKKATEAVDIFRRSSEFEKELAESTAFAFDLGFQECKTKVKHVYGLAEVDDLEPDDLEDQTEPSTPAQDPSSSEP